MATHVETVTDSTARRIAPRGAALALVWGLAVTLLRALRWPNDWAMAHWLITYQFGPIKRALPGTLLAPLLATPFGFSHAQAIIVGISAVILAGFCLAYLLVVRSIIRLEGWTSEGVLLGLVLATSPLVVVAGHVNGYFDNAFFVLGWWAIDRTFRGRRLAAALVLVAAMLAHETVFVVGLPAVLLAAWLAGDPESDAARRGERAPSLARRVTPFLLPVLVFGALVVNQKSLPDPAATRAALSAHIARFPFVQNERNARVADALTTSFGDYAQAEGPRFWLRLARKRLVVTVLPGLVLCAVFVARRLRGRRVRPWAVLAGAAISAAPLAMQAIALDTCRFWAYALGTAATVVWIVLRAYGPPAGGHAPSPALRWACVGVLAINAVTTVELMDHAVERFHTVPRLLLYAPVLAYALFVAFAPGAAAGRTKPAAA